MVSAPESTAREELTSVAASSLEHAFLEYLETHQLHLPSRAGVLIEEAATRPDFLYDDVSAAVYIDGPPHDYPDRKLRDAEITGRLRDLGWTVIRFGHHDDWAQIIDSYRWVFGEGV